MKFHTSNNWILLLVLLVWIGTVQAAPIPKALQAAPVNPALAKSLQQVLQGTPAACGHEAKADELSNAGPVAHVRQHLTKDDPMNTVDAARKLIFTKSDLTAHELFLLLESLGGMNAAYTNGLLQSVFAHTDELALRLVPDDADADIAPKVQQSNIDDIQAAMVAAGEATGSNAMRAAIARVASGNSHAAARAKALLAR